MDFDSLKYNELCAKFLNLKQNSEGYYLLPTLDKWYGENNFSEWCAAEGDFGQEHWLISPNNL